MNFYYYVLRESFEDGVVESGYYASKLVGRFFFESVGRVQLSYLFERKSTKCSLQI